jgi:hypothetical protein
MVRNKRMPDNPLSAMELENEEIGIRHARTPLTDEEFVALFSTTLNSPKVVEGFDGRTRAMAYLISISSGLRRNELIFEPLLQEQGRLVREISEAQRGRMCGAESRDAAGQVAAAVAEQPLGCNPRLAK